VIIVYYIILTSLFTALASGVGSGGQCDRDAFMSSEFVLQALEMGFDYEAVRNVVHLKIVQSGIYIYICCKFVMSTKVIVFDSMVFI